MRFKIQLPEKKHYSCSLKITIDQINYGNHLSNDKVLVLCHEARIRFLSEQGLSELDCFGAGFIITDAQMEFIAEGKHGDELTIDLYIDLHSEIAFDFYHHMYTKERSIAKVKAGMLFFDYHKKKVRRIPAEFVELVDKLIG